ncbi:zinc finger protein 644 isoform X2 [Silurus meridionalis]|uniref:zinc finger protein 644 isoform X2 n=1 Tax=Silurus meridionalis TaxID=175797 RepID=UPI001EEABE0D|nr:zinc finger protein 644 isoform X2 [Silurus meridionalis]
MAAVRNSAEKEVESAEHYTQELSGSHTSSPTTSTRNNNSSSVGPQQCQSLDSHQSLLNGAQPNPFVCGGVLAAPCTDDSLPSGALVNGSASHCTSEEPHVPNKDASPLPGTDTNPEVLEPPCELQSNTWQKPEGHIMKAPFTRTLSESDNSDCETPLVGDNADNRAISRLRTNNCVRAGPLWDVDSESESSESSSDNYDGLNRSLREKFMCFLLKGRILNEVVKGKIKVGGTQSASSGRRKRKTCRVKRIPMQEKVNEDRASLINTDLDFDSSITEERSLRQDSESLKAHTDSHLGNSQDRMNLISSDSVGRRNEADTYVGGQPVPLKRQLETGLESAHSFFQCTKCNVNFKEKRNLHRHMMYHLDWHNQVGQASILRPFICKECGRSFCERSSLQKHMLIHQVQRKKLMEEIKDLNELRSQEGESQLQCPLCAFETNCPHSFIYHAKTHGKDHLHYSCEECNQIIMGKSDTEAHQQIAHLRACQGRVRKPLDVLLCKICTFRTKYRDVLRKHLELVHDQPLCDYELQSHNMAADLMGSVSEQCRKTDQTEAENLSSKFLREKQNKSGTGLPAWPSRLTDLFLTDNGTQNSCKSLSSSLIKWSFGSLANNLSPSSLQCDKPSKLSLPTERIDVTTGLSYVEEDNQKCESAAFKRNTKHLSSFYANPVTRSAIPTKSKHLDHDDDNTSKDPSPGSSFAVQKQKSPSKRKMSIPYHNTPKKIPLLVPKQESAAPEMVDIYSLQSGDYSSAHFDCANQAKDANCPSESIAHFLDSNDASDLLTQQGRLLKYDFLNSPDQSDLDGPMEDDDEISTLIVKEENMESAVSEDYPECTDPNLSDSYTSYCVSPVFEPDRKCCPYCPAVFETGVGLSNHIRGHLHRCGLSYEARHMLSPEQVASQDRQPRIRRRAPPMSNRIRRDKPESQTEHTCPLCLGWFDTKTGLSNHVRGHLKRIGKPISGVSKSPLCILNELLQDENEHRNVLRALETKPRLSRPTVSRKFERETEGLFLTPTCIPVNIQHSDNRLITDEGENRKGTEEKVHENRESTLVALLKRQKLDKEPAVTCQTKTARARFIISPSKKVSSEVLPDSICSQGKFEGDKKMCIHCNATFHSGVSLSNHLRAYARRKQIAMLEGTSYDCNQKLPRSRSGPKRKMFHTASEVIYTLTCRFCDLVFQGPQCVQEDWVKHLQRHLMHTAVRGTGAGMVEVPAVCEEPCAPDCVTQGL